MNDQHQGIFARIASHFTNSRLSLFVRFLAIVVIVVVVIAVFLGLRGDRGLIWYVMFLAASAEFFENRMADELSARQGNPPSQNVRTLNTPNRIALMAGAIILIVLWAAR